MDDSNGRWVGILVVPDQLRADGTIITKEACDQMALEGVLFDFVSEVDEPTGDAIQAFIEKHPQFEGEIIEFATSWFLSEHLPPHPDGADISDGELVARGMQVVYRLVGVVTKSHIDADVSL